MEGAHLRAEALQTATIWLAPQQRNIAAFTLLIFEQKASKQSLVDLMEQLTLRTCTEEMIPKSD